ncbi:hypothetical protein ACFX2I_009583 [Malus domestica]|uniref:Uncharacterized protein n=1 Tax=Malus domestica TaxID=3750 RepID=A0A498IC95_MALDO|nr:hypothetical protein DVH24_004513 [Malus domestica]
MGMGLSYQNLPWLALLLVLAFGIASSSSLDGKEKYNQLHGRWATVGDILSKGPPIQPSGAAAGEEHGIEGSSPPLPKIQSRRFHFGMLPKGTPIPPSGPGDTHNNETPPRAIVSEN